MAKPFQNLVDRLCDGLLLVNFLPTELCTDFDARVPNAAAGDKQSYLGRVALDLTCRPNPEPAKLPQSVAATESG